MSIAMLAREMFSCSQASALSSFAVWGMISHLRNASASMYRRRYHARI